jgi:S-adenosylmethionine-diacylglycerol 3-amino-3-carboxypropyl transferase
MCSRGRAEQRGDELAGIGEAAAGCPSAPEQCDACVRSAHGHRTSARRIGLVGAVDDRLYFAQVREDPCLEIEALAAGAADTVVVVSSGGCTALSLLAAGAGKVVAVDLNRTQNHVVELKLAAISELSAEDATRFLGGWPATAESRRATYARLRPRLTPAARLHWDARRVQITGGVITAGVSERFIGAIMRVVRTTIHPPGRVRRLLACRTLEEQQRLYETEWNSRRWRLLFSALLNRVVFRKTYSPEFFQHVDNPSFARHFYSLAEHSLTRVPIATNYFVHQMLTDFYPEGVPGGLPPYLDQEYFAALGGAAARLTMVDGSYGDYLKTCAGRSLDGFALSNICEWLTAEQTDELLTEIVRTARPGARLVLRNFVGWTDLPAKWAGVIVADTAAGERLIAQDRSAVQRRFVIAEVNASGRMTATARAATPDDNGALLALTAACPMEGDVGLCLHRSPDFFALNRLEGQRWWVGVVDGPAGSPIVCVAVAERRVYLHGEPVRSMYVSDLKVHPVIGGTGVADALTAYARDVCLLVGGPQVPTFLTVLAGNAPMERRLEAGRTQLEVERVGTIRAHSVSLLWRRRIPSAGLQIAPGTPSDIEGDGRAVQRVAPRRQFAPVYDAAAFAAWIEGAPALDTSHYRLARDGRGALVGFVGMWDQSSFKQLQVTSYARSVAAFRLGFNLLAPAFRAPRLPTAGGFIRTPQRRQRLRCA